jgi:hypothetical protein
MSKKKNRPSSKSNPAPQGSSVHNLDTEKQKAGKYHIPDRMETFPKPNTVPKKWDVSGFLKS